MNEETPKLMGMKVVVCDDLDKNTIVVSPDVFEKLKIGSLKHKFMAEGFSEERAKLMAITAGEKSG